MNLYSIFPTAVAKFELGREYTAEENAFVDSQETHKNQGNTTSNDRYVLRHDTMANLKAFAEASVNEYLRSIYAPKHDVSLRLTQSWLNYTKPGQYHHKHAHPNSFVSGVYYLQTNLDDRIYFYKDQYQQIKFPTDDWNAYNSDSWWFEAEAGKLILFPSSLTHMVPTVQGDVTRISLSFNTFPVGMVGEEMDLTGLKLEA